METNLLETTVNGNIQVSMSKEDIFKFLTSWFNEGLFTTTTKIKKDLGKSSRNIIESLCVSHQLSYTSMPKILFVGNKTRHPIWELFQKYYNEKRIMTKLEAKIQLDVPSVHRLNKAVNSGEVLRFEYHDAIIYVR